MFFFRRLIRRILFFFVIGFVIRKLLESSDPRAHRVGTIANRLMGNAFTPESGRRGLGGRRRSFARPARTPRMRT